MIVLRRALRCGCKRAFPQFVARAKRKHFPTLRFRRALGFPCSGREHFATLVYKRALSFTQAKKEHFAPLVSSKALHFVHARCGYCFSKAIAKGELFTTLVPKGGTLILSRHGEHFDLYVLFPLLLLSRALRCTYSEKNRQTVYHVP